MRVVQPEIKLRKKRKYELFDPEQLCQGGCASDL